MTNEINKTAKNLALNLADLRRKSNLTQMQLAKISNIKRATIALLESGNANPTLEILLKISQGLRVSIDELLSSPKAECRLIKAIDVPVDRRSKNGIYLRKILPDKLRATEIDEITLDVGAVLTGSPHIEGTREYFTCIKGEVMIGVLGEKYNLQKGDVLSFPGDKPHSYKNIGHVVAQGIGVVLFASDF